MVADRVMIKTATKQGKAKSQHSFGTIKRQSKSMPFGQKYIPKIRIPEYTKNNEKGTER